MRTSVYRGKKEEERKNETVSRWSVLVFCISIFYILLERNESSLNVWPDNEYNKMNNNPCSTPTDTQMHWCADRHTHTHTHTHAQFGSICATFHFSKQIDAAVLFYLQFFYWYRWWPKCLHLDQKKKLTKSQRLYLIQLNPIFFTIL